MNSKIFAWAGVIICGLFILSFKRNNIKSSAGTFEPIAVIELFTSQGCSSCPPADKLLTETIAAAKISGKKIFALSFHVDYWNRLGWTDPFSSSDYSQRQNNYASAFNLGGAYTPQMIVNGNTQFVGSDKNQLIKALTKALNTKAAINFKSLNAMYNNKTIKVQYALEGNAAAGQLNFALISFRENTLVKRGENGGHILINENVVRQWIHKKASVSGQVEFPGNIISSLENSAVIAFFQQENNLNITGAAMVNITN